MSNDDLNTIFNAVDSPVIDPASKRRAINSALAEFSAVHADSDASTLATAEEAKNNTSWLKGLLAAFRPTEKHESFSRRSTMANQRWIMGSAVTASVIVFAGFIAVRNPAPQDGGSLHEYPPSTPSEVTKPQINSASTGADNENSDDVGRAQALVDAGSTLKDAPENEVSVDSVLEESVVEDIAYASQAPVAESLAMAPSLASASSQKRMKPKLMARQDGAELKIAPMPMPAPMPLPNDHVIMPREENRERFENAEINPVKRVSDAPISTFSVDVDTSAYSFARRKLNRGVLPQSEAVRAEEFINYFDYDYPAPAEKTTPFSTNVVVSDSPWKPGNKLLHIGIKGYEFDRSQQPRSNLVFLLDVSGSMSSPDKLPLVKQSISLLLKQLREDDTVSIVVYAGAAGTVLPPTKVKHKQRIFDAFNKLNAGGSTAGAEGIKLAYQLAESTFDDKAVNRIILATDGDFNVGISDPEQLKNYVERKRDKGIFLSVLGFGEGNYNDHLMQELAQNGNGVAAYIDSLSEAQKVLVEESTSSLFTIAKDVKIQIDFNPATVDEYRLIGYETRALKREDFNNDKVDAGDIGAGHTVTAIYEITPKHASSGLYDESRYGNKGIDSVDDAKANEYALLKLRYKLPKENTSKLIEQIVLARNTIDDQKTSASTWQTIDVNFATAVAGFAQLLAGGKYIGEWSYDDVINMALEHRGEDVFGYRNEFVQLVRKAKISDDVN